MKPHQWQIVVHLLLCCLILLGIPSKGYNCIQKGGTTVFTQNIQLSVFQPHSPDSCSHLAYFYSSSFLDCELPCCSSSSSSSSSSGAHISARWTSIRWFSSRRCPILALFRTSTRCSSWGIFGHLRDAPPEGFSVSHRFSQFLTVFHRFSLFLTVSHCFSPFLTVFHRFPPFLTVFQHFPPFSTVAHCFSPFLTVFHCYSLLFTVFHRFSSWVNVLLAW